MLIIEQTNMMSLIGAVFRIIIQRYAYTCTCTCITQWVVPYFHELQWVKILHDQWCFYSIIFMIKICEVSINKLKKIDKKHMVITTHNKALRFKISLNRSPDKHKYSGWSDIVYMIFVTLLNNCTWQYCRQLGNYCCQFAIQSKLCLVRQLHHARKMCLIMLKMRGIRAKKADHI